MAEKTYVFTSDIDRFMADDVSNIMFGRRAKEKTKDVENLDTPEIEGILQKIKENREVGKIVDFARSLDADLVMAGDLGPALNLDPSVLKIDDVRITTVPGNWDSVEGYAKVTRLPNVFDAHLNITPGGWVGYGGGESTPGFPGADPKSWYCGPLIGTQFIELMEHAKAQRADKLVLHTPPKGLVDWSAYEEIEMGGQKVIRPRTLDYPGATIKNEGNGVVRAVLNRMQHKPTLVVAGHCHYPSEVIDDNGNLTDPRYPVAMTLDGRSVSKGETVSNLIVNPGPGVYHIDNDPSKPVKRMVAVVKHNEERREATYVGHVRL